jgi:hypothetical protein
LNGCFSPPRRGSRTKKGNGWCPPLSTGSRRVATDQFAPLGLAGTCVVDAKACSRSPRRLNCGRDNAKPDLYLPCVFAPLREAVVVAVCLLRPASGGPPHDCQNGSPWFWGISPGQPAVGCYYSVRTRPTDERPYLSSSLFPVPCSRLSPPGERPSVFSDPRKARRRILTIPTGYTLASIGRCQNPPNRPQQVSNSVQTGSKRRQKLAKRRLPILTFGRKTALALAPMGF